MKKKIGSNYGILVIFLFATVCFMTDYIVIERKLNEGKNNVIETNTDCVNSVCNCDDNATYNYDSVAGYYKENITFSSEKTDSDGASFMLHLYSNGTYSYRYSYAAPFGTIGNYIIKDNTIILNALAETGSGAGINTKLFDVKRILVINEDGSLTDNDAPMVNITGVKLVTLHREANDPIQNENEFRNFFNYDGE